MSFHSLFPLDRRPLNEDERALIRRAETEAWTDELGRRLAKACIDRGLLVGTYDNCGDLVETLEGVASEESGT